MVALGALLGLVLAEVGLRLLRYTPRVARPALSNWVRVPVPFHGGGYLHRAHDVYRQSWPSDPRGYFGSPEPHLDYQLNNYGFRDREFELPRNDSLRIAVLGDSICFGHGVKEEDVLTRRLERKLAADRPLSQRYEVYNFCLQGYNTRAEAALYEHVVAAFRPDLLLVVYCLNDVNEPPRRYFGPLLEESSRTLALRRRLLLADLLFDRLEGPRYRARFIAQGRLAYEDGQPGLRTVVQELERLAGRTRADHVPAILALFPWLSDLDRSSYPFLGAHRAVARTAGRLGFRTMDLLDAFVGQSPEDLWVHVVDHHPNERAHELAADALYPPLVAALERSAPTILAEAARRRHEVPPAALASPASREWYLALGRDPTAAGDSSSTTKANDELE